MNNPGFMYIYVFEVAPGYKKIGITDDVQRRIKQVRTHNPLIVRIAYTRIVPKDVALWIERHVHRNLRPFHIRGEWFQLELKPICEAIHNAMASAGVEIETRREQEKPIVQSIARAEWVVDFVRKNGQSSYKTLMQFNFRTPSHGRGHRFNPCRAHHLSQQNRAFMVMPKCSIRHGMAYKSRTRHRESWKIRGLCSRDVPRLIYGPWVTSGIKLPRSSAPKPTRLPWKRTCARVAGIHRHHRHCHHIATHGAPAA